MKVEGRELLPKSPREGVRARMALITEDRKAEGLSLNQSILDNALSVIRSVFPRRTGAVRTEIPGVFSSLEVVARDLDQEVQYLSGGNQQKVVLAKWLAIRPRLVLLDEPTRGIDVGAKVAVYRLMRKLAAEGKAILMVSSELPEVIGMSDRILVMRDGRLAGELAGRNVRGSRPAAGNGRQDRVRREGHETARQLLRTPVLHPDRLPGGAADADRGCRARRHDRAEFLQPGQYLQHPDRNQRPGFHRDRPDAGHPGRQPGSLGSLCRQPGQPHRGRGDGQQPGQRPARRPAHAGCGGGHRPRRTGSSWPA